MLLFQLIQLLKSLDSESIKNSFFGHESRFIKEYFLTICLKFFQRDGDKRKIMATALQSMASKTLTQI
jgi:hypothetical protein